MPREVKLRVAEQWIMGFPDPIPATWECGTLAPHILGANQESRKIGLEHYKVFMVHNSISDAKKYINPKVDLLVIEYVEWHERLPESIRERLMGTVQHLEIRFCEPDLILRASRMEQVELGIYIKAYRFKALKNLILGFMTRRPDDLEFETLELANTCREKVRGIFNEISAAAPDENYSVPDVFLADRLCSLLVERHRERYRKEDINDQLYRTAMRLRQVQSREEVGHR